MKVLGIDPGLNITGFGILEVNELAKSITLITAGVIRGPKIKDLSLRLKSIYNELIEIIKLEKPEVMAIEDLYAHYKHPKTAIIMGHVRGVILLSAAENNIKTFHYNATRIKNSLVGSGRATKLQMQQMVKNRLELNSIPEPPDIADAIAVALCHIHTEHNTLFTR